MLQRPSRSRGQLRAVRRNYRQPDGPRRFWRVFLALLATLLAVAAIGVWFIRETVPTPESISLTAGTVEVLVETEALIVRPERLVTAATSGTVRRIAQESVRVRAGTPVVQIQPDSGGPIVEVNADQSGIILYQTDGLEPSLDPTRMSSWTPTWFKGLEAPAPRQIGEGKVQAGEPLFKIADNIGQGVLALTETAAIPLLESGATLKVRFTGRDTATVPARIARLNREGAATLLYLVPQTTPEALSGIRRTRMSLIFAAYAGTVAPRTAIDVRGGKQGVWVLEENGPQFAPVKVTGGNAEQVVLETQLPPGTRILKVAPTHLDR